MSRLLKSEQERMKQEALNGLRGYLPFGTRVYPVLTHVSRSGMSRNFKVLVSVKETNEVRNISHLVSNALDLRWNGDGSLSIGGCGMDMGYHLVYLLATALGHTELERDYMKAYPQLVRGTNCYGLNHGTI